MKILKQEKKDSRVEFEIESDFEALKKFREEVITEYAKELHLPGFRQGKAPKNLVEQNLNPDAVNDKSLQKLISSLYPLILKESKIDPIDYPDIDIVTFEENKPIVFKLGVDTYPEINLGKYKGLKVSKKPETVTDNDVVGVLGDLQNRFAKHLEINEGQTQKDDIVDLDIQAESEGIPVKRWPKLLQQFPIGQGYISPEFDLNITGLTPNEEKSFTVAFAADYGVPEISGKSVKFNVKIIKISRKSLLPLDDSFAKTVSNFGTLAELKEEVKKSLQMEKKEEAEEDLKNQIITEVAKGSKVVPPNSMLKTETELLIEELKTSLSRSNLTLQDYLKGIQKTEADLRNDFKGAATARTTGKLVLKKVAEVEKLEVAPHDLDTEIALYAQSAGQKTEEYKKTLGPGGIAYITDSLSRRKALDFLISHAEIITLARG